MSLNVSTTILPACIPSPNVTDHMNLGNEKGESVDEVFVVFFVSEDLLSFDSPDNDMMENSRGIEAGLPWHGFPFTPSNCICQLNYLRTSPFLP